MLKLPVKYPIANENMDLSEYAKKSDVDAIGASIDNKADKKEVEKISSQLDTNKSYLENRIDEIVSHNSDISSNSELIGIRTNTIGSTFATAYGRVDNIENIIINKVSRFCPSFAIGAVNSADGSLNENVGSIRTDYLNLKSYGDLNIVIPSGLYLFIKGYDSNKTVTYTKSNLTNTTFVLSPTESYYVFIIDDGTGTGKLTNANLINFNYTLDIFPKEDRNCFAHYEYKPVFDLINKTFTIYNNTRIVYKDKFVNLSKTVLDLSQNRYNVIYYDETDRIVKGGNLLTTPINYKSQIVLGVIDNTNGNGSFVCDYDLLKVDISTDKFIYFQVDVNQNFDNNESTSNTIVDSENFDKVWCMLRLPTNYDHFGKPCPLILSAHGAGGSVGDNTTVSGLRYHTEYTTKGFAMFDCNGSSSTSATSMGSSRAISTYWKAYQYILKNYNVEPMIFVHGQSMGGLVALNFLNAHSNVVKACGLWYPCTDLKGQAWDNPWYSGVPKQIASEYNFNDKSGTTWESEKVIGYNPINNNNVNVPLKIWHGTIDTTVSYAGSVTYVNKMREKGNQCYLRTLTGQDHQENDVMYKETLYWFKRHN